MGKKILFIGLFSLVLILGFISVVHAASPGTNATLEFVEDFTSGIGDKLLGYARGLFVGLATLSLAMGLGKMILSGESNVGSVAAHIAKWIIYVGVFFWIMSSSGVGTFLPKLIVNSFMEAGKSIAGQEVAPDDLLRVNGKTTVNSLDYENYPPKAQAKIATEQVTRLLLGDDLDAADKDEMLQAIQSAYWDYRRR